jgi:hypothetical protein
MTLKHGRKKAAGVFGVVEKADKSRFLVYLPDNKELKCWASDVMTTTKEARIVANSFIKAICRQCGLTTSRSMREWFKKTPGMWNFILTGDENVEAPRSKKREREPEASNEDEVEPEPDNKNARVAVPAFVAVNAPPPMAVAAPPVAVAVAAPVAVAVAGGLVPQIPQVQGNDIVLDILKVLIAEGQQQVALTVVELLRKHQMGSHK